MTKKDLDQSFQSNPLYKKMLVDLHDLHPRFPPEPVFAQTGKGNLKSKGVSELQKIKSSLQKTKSDKDKRSV